MKSYFESIYTNKKMDNYKVKKLAKDYDMTVNEFKNMIKDIVKDDITAEEVQKMVAGTK